VGRGKVISRRAFVVSKETHVASSPASVGGDADDAVTNDAVDVVAVGVADDRGSHEVQELEIEMVKELELNFPMKELFECTLTTF